MRKVPSEHFVPQWLKGEVYEDRPLSIGAGQLISQPSYFLDVALSVSGRYCDGSGVFVVLGRLFYALSLRHRPFWQGRRQRAGGGGCDD